MVNKLLAASGLVPNVVMDQFPMCTNNIFSQVEKRKRNYGGVRNVDGFEHKERE